MVTTLGLLRACQLVNVIPLTLFVPSEPSLRPQYVRLRSRVLVSNRQALQNVCTKRLARCRIYIGSQLSLVTKETTK